MLNKVACNRPGLTIKDIIVERPGGPSVGKRDPIFSGGDNPPELV